MAPSFQHLAYTGGPVTEIRINRPKSLNSLTPDVYRELAKAFLLADTDPACVVVVFTGEGRFFSSGADVKANSGDPFADIKDPLDRRIAFAEKDSLVLELKGSCWT